MRLVSDDTWAVMTIWQEARGEPYAGKLAVAEVIRNRMTRRFNSDGTVPGTVLSPYQFSGWNTMDPNRRRAALIDDTHPLVQDCIKAWAAAQAGSQTIGDAVFYYNPQGASKIPDWAKPEHLVKQIGSHYFFTG